MKKNSIYFIAIAFLVAKWLKILIYANERTCDVSRTQDDVKSQIVEHLCKDYVYWVESLQSWCAARTTYCDSSYDVTIATYLLPALYISKMKNALFILLLQSLTDFLVLVLCNVHIRSDQPNEHQEQITVLEGGKL